MVRDDFASKAIKFDHEPRSLRMAATRLQHSAAGTLLSTASGSASSSCSPDVVRSTG